MSTFFCRLLPPRRSFALDMTDDERALMQAHAAYWQEHIDAGRAIVFGLVADPDGPYGIGIVELPDEAGAQQYVGRDPVIAADRGFRYEVFPMPFGAAHRRT